MKKLGLKKEILSELSVAELSAVAGGAESESCPITYKCVNISESPEGCFNSNICATAAIIRAVKFGGC